MLSWILLSLALLSALLNVWQWWAARRFPLHERARTPFAPPLSILRPLKGCDSRTEECLESWFEQNYSGGRELLFGVASAEDPVCEIVRRLMRRHPGQLADLVVCQPILGANAKVSSLCHLVKRARHEHLVIADQDVFISTNFLGDLIAPLGEKEAGLVNCFYILGDPQGLPMRLEAVAVNADFWSQVLQGNMLKPMDFALGAVMATTRERLEVMGGFEGLLDYLADDYQLGHRIARNGARLELCRTPVECRSEPQSGRAVWLHQLRWARTIRVCQPLPYFFSILSNGTLWPLLALFANPAIGALCCAGALLLRILTASSNYARLTRKSGWRAGLLAPVKDLLQVAVWASAFIGNEITWRGQRFRVDGGGKLTPVA